MTKYRDLAYGDRLPESWTDAIQEFISTYVSPNFAIGIKSPPTSIEIVAGTGNSQVGCGVDGLWRYISATINAAHPGGTAGTYDIFVTASNNSFTLGPPEVDNTVYAFGLQIKAQGQVPSTDRYRKVGTCEWTGTAIASVAALVGTAAFEMPAGAVTPFAGSVAPSGWLFCDGSEVSRSTYARLFAVIGTTYGSGNGSTTFNLPNTGGRVVAGKAAAGTFGTLGATGGSETQALTEANLPAHTHVFTGVALSGHTHVFTGTPLGNHGHTFTGTALGAHGHTFSGNALGAHGHTFSGVEMETHAHFIYGGVLWGHNFHRDVAYSGWGVCDMDSVLGLSGDYRGNVITEWDTAGTPAGSISSVSAGTPSGTVVAASAGTPAGTINSVSAGTPAGSNSSVSAGTPAGTNSSVGSNVAHNNLQPFLVLNYVIKT